jgi:hypothetical protein
VQKGNGNNLNTILNWNNFEGFNIQVGLKLSHTCNVKIESEKIIICHLLIETTVLLYKQTINRLDIEGWIYASSPCRDGESCDLKSELKL